MKQETVPIVTFFTAIRDERLGQIEIVCTKLQGLFDVILLSDEKNILEKTRNILEKSNMFHGEFDIMDRGNIFRKYMVLIDTFTEMEEAIAFANKLERCLRTYYE